MDQGSRKGHIVTFGATQMANGKVKNGHNYKERPYKGLLRSIRVNLQINHKLAYLTTEKPTPDAAAQMLTMLISLVMAVIIMAVPKVVRPKT